jgi:putative ABC transport system substrate-binding protein
VNTNREVDSAFASLRQKRCDALWIGPGSLFVSRRAQIVAAAAHNAIPAVYPVRDFVEIGGLASYGANQFDQYRQVGLYAGRILKGEKPAELPVVRADKFELVINLHTAKLLGLTVPPQLLIRADEVIE